MAPHEIEQVKSLAAQHNLTGAQIIAILQQFLPVLSTILGGLQKPAPPAK